MNEYYVIIRVIDSSFYFSGSMISSRGRLYFNPSFPMAPFQWHLHHVYIELIDRPQVQWSCFVQFDSYLWIVGAAICMKRKICGSFNIILIKINNKSLIFFVLQIVETLEGWATRGNLRCRTECPLYPKTEEMIWPGIAPMSRVLHRYQIRPVAPQPKRTQRGATNLQFHTNLCF